MPTEVAEQVEKKTKAYAQKVVDKLKQLTGKFIPDYWEIAETISEIHEKNIWQIMGFESREAFIYTTPISKASWYERRKLWDGWCAPALKDEHITRARLNRLQSQNVKELMRLGDNRMFHQKWVEKALNLSEAELRDQVDHALHNDTEPEEGLGNPESNAVIKWVVAASEKTFILDTIHEFAERQGLPLDEEPQSLAKMLADYRAGWPEAGKIVED